MKKEKEGGHRYDANQALQGQRKAKAMGKSAKHSKTTGSEDDDEGDDDHGYDD